MLVPGNTIGIIGGGQLGRMLAMAAARLGFKTIILDPQSDAPAFQCANDAIIAAYDDHEGLGELFSRADVVTYEFENVPVAALKQLDSNTPVFPPALALETSQDRLVEKTFFNRLQIDTAPFFDVFDGKTLSAALKQTGGSGILKTRHLGYDGKGQIRISPDDGGKFDEAAKLAASTPCILEGLISFEREISVIAARGMDSSVIAFDPPENVHHDSLLRQSTVPAKISNETAGKAIETTGKVLAALDYVGVIGIEFFLMADGSLLANEFAPRVHNSGHWTEAACTVSQFEQHIRAICGLPLADAVRHSDCRMENLIGDEVDRLPEILAAPDTLLHLYGKAEVQQGRKMGHFTRISRKL